MVCTSVIFRSEGIEDFGASLAAARGGHETSEIARLQTGAKPLPEVDGHRPRGKEVIGKIVCQPGGRTIETVGDVLSRGVVAGLSGHATFARIVGKPGNVLLERGDADAVKPVTGAVRGFVPVLATTGQRHGSQYADQGATHRVSRPDTKR